MIKAKDIMTSDPVVVIQDWDISKATTIMIEKGFNGLPVVDDDGRLVGIICQSDIIVQQKKLPLPSYFTFLDGLISLRSIKSLEKAYLPTKICRLRTSHKILHFKNT